MTQSESRATRAAESLFGTAAIAVGFAAVVLGLYTALNFQKYAVSAILTFVYVVGPLGGGGSILIACWLMPRRRAILGLVLTSLGLGLIVSEIGLGLIEGWTGTRSTRPSGEVTDLVERRAKDRTLYPVLTPSRIAIHRDGRWFRSSIKIGEEELLPLGGISRTNSLFCKTSERVGWLEYVSDEHGFNNPAGLWNRPDVRLVLIGDSFAQGFCVREAGTIAGQLRRHVEGVLNLGLMGNGPLAELAVLREWGPAARPRFVAWFFWEGNDFSDLEREKATPALLRYLDPGHSQGLAGRQSEVDALMRDFVDTNLAAGRARTFGDISSSDRWRKTLSLYRLRSALGVAAKKPVTTDYESFRRILTEARDTASKWGGEIVFVALPRSHGGHFGGSEIYRRAVDTARSLDFQVVDILPALEKAGAQTVVDEASAGHYSETGYRIVAEALAAKIRDLSANVGR